MNEALPDKESSDYPKSKLRVHPQVLLSALYAAGLVGFFEILRAPLSHGLQWSQGSTLILFSSGSLIAALLLIVLNRAAPLTPARVKTLMVTIVVLATSATILFFLATVFSFDSARMEMCALFLASCGMPLAIFVWALVYKSLCYRDVLLNSGLTYILFSVLLLLSVQVFTGFTHLICAVFLLAGSAATILFKNTIITEIDRSLVEYPENHDSEEEVTPLKFLVSVPLTGLILYAITSGLVLKANEAPFSPLTVTVTCIATAAVLVFVTVKLPRQPDRQLMFFLYGFGLPAIAGIALVIKMIPIDFFSSTVFREFMMFYFQILTLGAWTYLVGYTRIGSTTQTLYLGLTQTVLSLSLLLGYLANEMGYPLNLAFLGLITSAFLLFAMITVGRNIILYARGPETAEELAGGSLSIETACDIVSLEYRLSPREVEVLKELAYGHSSSYIAKVLFISTNTARTHMKNIYKKLAINSREDLLELIRAKQG